MKKFILPILLIGITYSHCPKPRDSQSVLSIEEWNNFNPQDPGNEFLLIRAVSFNDLNIARALLGLRVNPNLRNPHQYSLLQIAVANNNYEMAKLLLDLQADPNAQDIQGKTALHHACHASNNQIAELLLSHPTIRPYTTDNNGNFPLDFVRGENAEAIRQAFREYDQRTQE